MSISYRGVTAGTAFTFLGTSAIQTLRIPNGVSLIEVYLWGAGGRSGGAGGFVSGKLSVVPNQTLQIIVGVVSDINGAVLAKGNGGGYQNFRSVGFGGGFSGVFSTFPTQPTALAIAGGGGGGTGVGGGGGGYPSGANGTNNGANAGGGGGTQTAGGAGSGGIAQSGFALTGGAGNGANDFSAGSGGGGWFGGGGGRNGSGAGGGSSYIDKLIDATFENGGSGTNVTGPAQTNPYWQSPAGNTNSSGLVVIVYATIFPLYNVIRLNPTAVVVSQSRVFSATGAIQTFTVPANVTAIRFFLWGSGGTGQNGVTNVNTAGGGAFVEGNILTTPGTVYSIIVGRRGVTGLANGGGTTGGTFAGGGGFSGIFSGSPAANTVIAIAGGGAGSGFNARGFGGGGGYPSGASGTGSGSQGGGGTQIAGGSSTFAAGTQLAGGNGGGLDNGGGGGGGGWYGGGGGNAQGAGGGGSSTYISSVINPITSNGGNGGVSQVTPTPAGGETSPYWISPFGRAGQNGVVVIGFSPTLPRLRMSSFNPTKFSGLALWLDAADASTLVLSGTNVTQWNDKSGGGFHAVQTTSSYYPTYNSATRTISCSNNGTNPQFLDVPQGMQTTQPVSIFAVSSWTQYSASGVTFLDKRKAANLQPLYQMVGGGVAFRDGINPIVNTGWTFPQNTRSILGIQGALNTQQTFVNGTAQVSLTNSFTMPATDTFTFRIGALNEPVPANIANVRTFSASSQINELIVYNAFLSQDQRQQIEGYLAWKWGLRSSLPNNNLYKTIQPPP